MLGYSGWLFPPSVLDDSPSETVRNALGNVPDGLRVRPLHVDDYSKGYLDLLGQLTDVGQISAEGWRDRFRSMQQTSPASYFVVVVEDTATSRIVGGASLVLEWKFIHATGARGRIEDVVVDRTQRHRRLGCLLNRILVALARQAGVYKLSLECANQLVTFYEQFGYKSDGNNYLVQRFDH